MQPSVDATFHDFELAGWQRAAEHYDDAFGSLTTQTIQPLLKAAGVTARTRVLDIATGPGGVAAAAADLGATPVGIDFSAHMIAIARQEHPSLRFEEGDATTWRRIPEGRQPLVLVKQ